MSTEWFFKLKEYDSLEKMRINHLKLLNEQNDRLSKLKARRDENNSHLEELKLTYISLQQELHETEKKLKTSTEQRQNLLDRGGDEQKISHFLMESQKFEDHGMELLFSMEKNETERAEARQFGEGLEKTFLEIENEVIDIKNKTDNEVKNIELRLKLILEELPTEYKSLLISTQNKKLAHGPFTRIESGSCYFCRHKISRTDESEIDMQKMLKVCTQCSRIFLPYGA